MATNLPSSTALYERFKPAERLVLLFEAMARRDDAEIERVRRTCPRKTYSGPDMAFEDRYEMALDATVVVCGDLKALVAQLRLLAWARHWVERTCTAHQITASMAFLDGVQHGKGRAQTPFFRMNLKEQVRAAAKGAGDSKGSGPQDAVENPEEEIDEPRVLGKAFYDRMHGVERRSERRTRRLKWLLRRAEMDLAKEMNNVWSAYAFFCQSRVGLPAQRLLEASGYPGREELAEYLERFKDVPLDQKAVAEYRDGLCGFWDRQFGAGQ